MTPELALSKLKAGHRRFMAEEPQAWRAHAGRRAKIARQQTPFAAIVTCSDARVAPEIVFDQSLGDLFVVRVAGVVYSPEIRDSLEFAVGSLDVPLIVLMGHSRCAALSEAIRLTGDPTAAVSVLRRLLPAVRAAKAQGHHDLELLRQTSIINAERVERRLLEQSALLRRAVKTHRLRVQSAFYRVRAGLVEWRG